MNKNSLRICMFSNLYPPVVSGSSIQTASLSRELVKRGHEVIVITAKIANNSPEYENVDGISIYRLPAIRLPKMSISLNFPWLSYTFTPRNLRHIKHIIEQRNPDVLHLHNHMFDLAFSAVRIHRQNNKPLIITVHTVIKHARRIYNVFLYPSDRVFLKHVVMNQADAIICPDINTNHYVFDAFGKSNTALVPYGISVPESPHNGLVERLRTEYHLDGKRIILSLGHVHAIRNRKDLIEALPGILKVFPNTVLLIVGTVADNFPKEWAHKLGVYKSVIFTGHVPHSDIPGFLELADLEAHWLNQDTKDKTSLGIASLEAMGSGKVVLAAANENTHGQGVLRNGENIILVEPENPDKLAQIIIHLLSDHEKRQAIGERARQVVQEHFSWDSVCSKTLEVYKNVLLRRQLYE